MNQDEIIEMAREAHRKLVTEVYVGHRGQLDPWTLELLKIFAKLVAAKEREACAEIAEKQRYAIYISLTSNPAQNGTAFGILNQIRARGEA